MRKKYKDKDWLKEKYIERNNCLCDIASQTSVTPKTIQRWLKRYQIEKDHGWAISSGHDKGQKYRDKEWLKKEYFSNKKSVGNISNSCSVSRDTIYYWFDKHDICINPQTIKENKKLCSRCRQWLKLDKFYSKKSTKTDLSNYCKKCGFPLPKDANFYLYFIRMGKYTKIGVTGNIKNRMRHIWNSNPYDIEAYKFQTQKNEETARKNESEIHNTLGKFNKRGEWFHLEQENMSGIQESLPIKISNDFFV